MAKNGQWWEEKEEAIVRELAAHPDEPLAPILRELLDWRLLALEHAKVEFRDGPDEREDGEAYPRFEYRDVSSSAPYSPALRIRHILSDRWPRPEIVSTADCIWLKTLLQRAAMIMQFGSDERFDRASIALAIYELWPRFSYLSERVVPEPWIVLSLYISITGEIAANTLAWATRRLGVDGRSLVKSAAICRDLISEGLRTFDLWPYCLTGEIKRSLRDDQLATLDDAGAAFKEFWAARVGNRTAPRSQDSAIAPGWIFPPGQFRFGTVGGKLSGKPLQLLKLLADHPNGASRDQIKDILWPDEPYVDEGTVRQLVGRTRRALRESFGIAMDSDPVPIADFGEKTAWRLDDALLRAHARNPDP